MKKISLEQARKLLNSLVEDVELVEDDKQADKDVDIDAIISESTERIQASAPIDQDLIATEASKKTGRLLDTLRSQMAKTFGGSQRDYAGSDDKPLTIQEIVALAKAKFDERTGQQAKDWETERLQLIEEHEAALETTKADYEKQVQAERNKYIERDITSYTLSMIEKIPRKGGDLADDTDTLLYKARQAYEVKYNEEKKAIEFWKDGKQSNVKPEDFAKQYFEKQGRLATDTRHIAPKDIKNNPAPIQPGILPKEPTEKQIPENQVSLHEWANQE